MNPALNILLVEDNEGDVELVERAIKRGEEPCRLSVAHNGLEALDLLHRHEQFGEVVRPDFIFLDINMPGMDGKTLLENLKQDDGLCTIPTIMLTSSSAPRDIMDCCARQVSCYIVKPVDPYAFMDLVRKVVAFWSDVARLPSRAAPVEVLARRRASDGGRRH
jgi:CheY-like chemotaxis protein